MRRFLIVLLAVASLVSAAPSPAAAGPCGLPDSRPLWIDFGVPVLASVFARPGTILAVSSGAFPAQARARGSATIYWDMHLNKRVGTPSAPADPAVIDERAHRLFVGAASQSDCATPWIVLNELAGAHLETPWTPKHAQYRANVLALMRGLATRGARPLLLIARAPFTGGDAAAWWRSVAEVGDIVPEVYPNARLLWAHGPIVANRRLRAHYRRAVARLVGIGVPVERIGLILGFQSAPGTGGREGLRRRHAWFEVIKWQALSARQVASEMKVGTILSWGWGTYSEAGRDPDKPDAACVYLWARNPNLCNGPAAAGEGFNASRRQGQLILPSGAMCTFGRNTIRVSAIARLGLLVEDRDVAYSALFARLTESATVNVSRKEILGAERAVVQQRFGGNVAAYRAVLAKAGAPLDVVRAVLADAIRRRKIELRLRVPAPSAAAIAGFYADYGNLLVRTVQARGSAPWWVGPRRTGLALSSVAPSQVFEAAPGRHTFVRTLTGSYVVRPLDAPRPLGAVPLAQARPAISSALTQFARRDAVMRWSAARQVELLRTAVCRRDDLPMPAAVDLQQFLPFPALEG